MNRSARFFAYAMASVVALALGAFAATAAAQATSGSSTSITSGQEEPPYPTNESGETYGSAMYASSPDSEPDLILAESVDGVSGYVRKLDIDSIQPVFKSPEEALKWQEENWGRDFEVPLYASDGRTVLGVFVVQGSPDNLKDPSEMK